MIGEFGDSFDSCAQHLKEYAENVGTVPEGIETIHEQLRTAVRGVAMAREALDIIAKTSASGQAQLDAANEHIVASAEAVGENRIIGTSSGELRSLPSFTSQAVKSSTEIADTLRQSHDIASILHRALTDGEPMLVGLYEKTQGSAANLKTWRLGAIRRAHALEKYIQGL